MTPRPIHVAFDETGNQKYPRVYVLVSTTNPYNVVEKYYRRRLHPKRFKESRLKDFLSQEGNDWRCCMIPRSSFKHRFNNVFPTLLREISKEYGGDLRFRLDIDGDKSGIMGFPIESVDDVDEVRFYPKIKSEPYLYHNLLRVADSLANLLGRIPNFFWGKDIDLPDFYREIGLERRFVPLN